MARSSGWAGVVQMSNPTDELQGDTLNAYIECFAKNRRKAIRVLEGIAKEYYPGYREHVVLTTSPLDVAGSIMEAELLEFRIDELVSDGTVVTMKEGGKPVGTAKKQALLTLVPPTEPVATGAASTTPAATTATTTYTVRDTPFTDTVLSKAAIERAEYDKNMRRPVVTTSVGVSK